MGDTLGLTVTIETYPEAAMLTLFTCVALANGGPDDWTHATPIGSARPTTKAATQLVSEHLKVTLHEDYDMVNARAIYHLHNPGETEKVRYAVPKLDELMGNQDVDSPHKPALELFLDGRPMPCVDRALPETLPIPFTHKQRVNPAGLDDPPEHPVYNEQVITFHVGTACEVELTVPPGNHELVLDVVEEPLHISWSTREDKHPGISDRRWVWLLAPAGSWAGKVDDLSIDIDLGPHATTAQVHGDGWTVRDTHRLKTLEDVDLKQVEPLVIDLGVRDKDLQNVILKKVVAGDSAWKPVGGKASSTLKPQGSHHYGAENLIDGDPTTAWCEGVDGPGVGEWVQLRYSKPVAAAFEPDSLALQVAMIGGYAKSHRTWTTNGRVAKIEVSACDGSEKQDLEVPERDDPRAALFLSSFGEDLYSWPLPPIATAITRRWVESGEEACIQVRILEVEAGSRYEDTCISELAFPVVFLR